MYPVIPEVVPINQTFRGIFSPKSTQFQLTCIFSWNERESIHLIRFGYIERTAVSFVGKRIQMRVFPPKGFLDYEMELLESKRIRYQYPPPYRRFGDTFNLNFKLVSHELCIFLFVHPLFATSLCHPSRTANIRKDFKFFSENINRFTFHIPVPAILVHMAYSCSNSFTIALLMKSLIVVPLPATASATRE